MGHPLAGEAARLPPCAVSRPPRDCPHSPHHPQHSLCRNIFLFMCKQKSHLFKFSHEFVSQFYFIILSVSHLECSIWVWLYQHVGRASICLYEIEFVLMTYLVFIWLIYFQTHYILTNTRWMNTTEVCLFLPSLRYRCCPHVIKFKALNVEGNNIKLNCIAKITIFRLQSRRSSFTKYLDERSKYLYFISVFMLLLRFVELVKEFLTLLISICIVYKSRHYARSRGN